MSEEQQVEPCGAELARPLVFGFLLLPRYTMMSLVSAVEPLRMANELSGRELYRWLLLTESGDSVPASDGILCVADAAIADHPALDTLVVAGGQDISHSFSPGLLRWLRGLDQKGVQLGGICTGAFVLASAGLLKGRECSIHWDCMATLQESCADVACNSNLFTVEEDRVTASGGTAPLDMMLNIISRDHGINVANGISEMFVLDRVRDQSDNQRVPLKHSLGVAPAKLVEATALMEANIEEPIALEELASLLSISRRQLERLFKKNLDCSPSRFYLKLRLKRARQLLKQTSLTVIEIASICGFVSTPHFSKCYRTHMGITPREERLGARALTPAASGENAGQNAGAGQGLDAPAQARQGGPAA
jgi:transcriptional regulator GlxA family with amidase domain